MTAKKGKSPQRQIVEDYCKMAKYFTWKDLTLAKRIYEENRVLFKKGVEYTEVWLD